MEISDYSIGKLMIGKREYEVKDCELNQAELLFYVDNPRVYSTLRNFDGSSPSQEEIENHMCNLDHVKQLKLSIKENGGLIDPLIVRDGDFAVLEGNSRLAAYRLLCKNDPVKWGKVKCKLLPADIDDSAIFTLLGQYHIVGRKDWNPYEQAGYLYRRKKDTKIPIEDIAKELGIVNSVAKNYIKVFEYMINVNDLNQEHWSYYEELLKNGNIQKEVNNNQDFEKMIVQQIQCGDIVAAADVRKIGKIAGSKTKKSKKILEDYKQGKIDLYEAYAEVEDSGDFDKQFKKVREFKEMIVDDSFLESLNENSKKNDIIFDLKKIRQKIDKIINGGN